MACDLNHDIFLETIQIGQKNIAPFLSSFPLYRRRLSGTQESFH